MSMRSARDRSQYQSQSSLSFSTWKMLPRREIATAASSRTSTNIRLPNPVIAGFFTGGALAVRGGLKAARNSAIACATLLAVIEGVGIGIQRMMAENTNLNVSPNAQICRIACIECLSCRGLANRLCVGTATTADVDGDGKGADSVMV